MHRYGPAPRLMELTDCIAANLGDAEIAARMGLSKFTVKGYVRRLMDRLEVTDKPALRRFASDLNRG
jgi:DNA-binding NarL/FixJ family response regulator